ncbi:hypothetical protein L3X38_038798 [Prunus dulcis]|uniref:Integrase catalytic domain-containing protein n=2 Tax=Prunus dulcis TaxID=3755 RepID=A0AAD4YRV0_PRUDU|nr:hypothetical protein L3X38_038798 [Prunus dulcis]
MGAHGATSQGVTILGSCSVSSQEQTREGPVVGARADNIMLGGVGPVRCATLNLSEAFWELTGFGFVGTPKLSELEAGAIPGWVTPWEVAPSIRTLTGSNYKKWREDVEIALGLLDYEMVLTDEALSVPANDASAETKAKYTKWIKANKMAILIMRSSISEEVRGSIIETENAKQFMEAIAENFQGSKKAEIGSLMSQLTDMKYNGEGCIRTHILNMVEIGNKLKALKVNVDETMLVHFAINSLPSIFRQLKTTYIAQKEIWSVVDLIVEVLSNSWWIDSGATVHVTNSLQGFKTKRVPNKDDLKVFVGNGERVRVDFVGLASLELESGFVLELVDVVYVPSMTRNLLSVSKLVKSNLQLEFDESGFSIFRNKSFIGNGLLIDGMFRLNSKLPNQSTEMINVLSSKRPCNTEPFTLWHKRLGHVSKERMNLLSKESILPPLNHHEQDKICIECAKGKLTNLRKKGAIRSEKLLEIIHTDICGPFPADTHDGFRYFITLTDDFSRYGYVYLITEKSKALEMFKIYKAEVENQLDSKIKVVRSDRGGEFYGKFTERGRNPGPFANFLQQEGIIAQYTNPGTPQQNGVSERRNRTLIEMVRSMMCCAKLPTFLWGEALKTANYLVNRVPTKATNKIPYEIWSKRKPSLAHLKTWGCKAEAKLYNPMQKKLDSKTVSCFFIRYPDRTKGYRFYCPKHNTRFVETQRAIFIEEEEGGLDDTDFDFDEVLENKETADENQMRNVTILPLDVLGENQDSPMDEERNNEEGQVTKNQQTAAEEVQTDQPVQVPNP